MNLLDLFVMRVICLLLFIAALVFDLRVGASEGKLPILYQQFLAGTNTSGFIIFERSIVFPDMRKRHSETGSNKNSVTINLNALETNYFSFLWEKTNFILACSSVAPLTNRNDFSSAERLYGYDGRSYWRLLSDSALTYINSGEDKNFLAPIDAASVLTVVSNDEVINSQGKYVPNAAVSVVKNIAGECWRVIQFGFSYPRQGACIVLNSNLITVGSDDGRVQSVRILGDFNRPDQLDYLAATNVRTKTLSSLDYAADTLKISRLSAVGGRPISIILYKILSLQLPVSVESGSEFSWPIYAKKNGGKIITEAGVAGATVSATITKNDSLKFGKVIMPAKPLPGHAYNRKYVYALFGFGFLMLPIILYVSLKKNKIS